MIALVLVLSILTLGMSKHELLCLMQAVRNHMLVSLRGGGRELGS
jgi:hypothetical protein